MIAILQKTEYWYIILVRKLQFSVPSITRIWFSFIQKQFLYDVCEISERQLHSIVSEVAGDTSLVNPFPSLLS